MSDMRLRLASVGVLAAVLLSSCSVVGGGGGKSYKLAAWFPKTIALFKDSQVRVLGLPAGQVTKVQAMGDKVRIEMKVKDSVPENLSNLVMECVKIKPEKRPTDMADVARRLDVIRYGLERHAARVAV